MLCGVLVDEQKDCSVRVAAGVALKNSLVSKDPQRRVEYGERWMGIAAGLREQIKSMLLPGLASREVRAGTAAAQAIAAIAFVEIPRDSWPELLSGLLANTHSADDQLRRCTIETIGFICEEIEPHVLESKANEILTAVINGLRSEETKYASHRFPTLTASVSVRTAAANALLNSLEFVKDNFDREAERNIIMKVICEATQARDESIVVPAFECLVKVLQLYYPQMELYMAQGVAQLTIASMQSPSESIVLQAIEFWSTICEIERDLQDADGSDFVCLDFSRKALPHLLPTLLAHLKSQVFSPFSC